MAHLSVLGRFSFISPSSPFAAGCFVGLSLPGSSEDPERVFQTSVFCKTPSTFFPSPPLELFFPFGDQSYPRLLILSAKESSFSETFDSPHAVPSRILPATASHPSLPVKVTDSRDASSLRSPLGWSEDLDPPFEAASRAKFCSTTTMFASHAPDRP